MAFFTFVRMCLTNKYCFLRLSFCFVFSNLHKKKMVANFRSESLMYTFSLGKSKGKNIEIKRFKHYGGMLIPKLNCFLKKVWSFDRMIRIKPKWPPKPLISWLQAAIFCIWLTFICKWTFLIEIWTFLFPKTCNSNELSSFIVQFFHLHKNKLAAIFI